MAATIRTLGRWQRRAKIRRLTVEERAMLDEAWIRITAYLRTRRPRHRKV